LDIKTNRKKKKKKKKGLIGSLIGLVALTGSLPLLIGFLMGAMLLLVIIASTIFIIFDAEEAELPCDCELYIAEEVLPSASSSSNSDTSSNVSSAGATGNLETASSSLDGITLTGGKEYIVPSTRPGSGSGRYGDTLSKEDWNRHLRDDVTYPGWGKGSNQRKLYLEYCEPTENNYIEGCFDSDGLGRIGERYVVAMIGTKFAAGDICDVYLSNGDIVKVVVGDTKDRSNATADDWGHVEGSGHSVIEFCVDRRVWYGTGAHSGQQIKAVHPEWQSGSKIYTTKIIDYGSIWDLKTKGGNTTSGTTTSGDTSTGDNTNSDNTTTSQTTSTNVTAVTSSTTAQSTSGGLVGTLGQYSGLWADLDGDIAKTTDGSNQDWKNLAQYVGHDPKSKISYENDQWVSLNGYGVVTYKQGKDFDYNNIKYSKSSKDSYTFGSSSCSVCSSAMVMSTMTGLKVTPAEVAIAANTLTTRGKANPWSGNVMTISGITTLFKDAGFTAEMKSGFDQSTINGVLDNNGFVIFVIGGNTPWGNTTGHYITLRGRNGDTYYTADSGGKNPTKGFTWAEITSGHSSKMSQGYVIVTSAPSNIKLSGGTSSNSGTGSSLTEQTTASGSVGYRIYKCKNCNCKGEYCECHKELGAIHKENGLKVYIGGYGDTTTTTTSGTDNQPTDSNTSSVVTVTPGNIQETPGQFQGTWGGKSTLEVLKDSSSGTVISDSVISKVQQYAGQASQYSGRSSYIYGIPRYSQWGTQSEAWKGKLVLGRNQSSGSDLFASGCGVYMVAHITSVLQQKLINPPEALLLCHHFGVLNEGGDYINSATGLNNLLNTMGYKVTYYSKAQISQNQDTIRAELDASLHAGIPCGYRTLEIDNIFNSGNHWLCIDAESGGKYLMVQSGKGATENVYLDWSKLYANFNDKKYCLYIVSKA
jgi:hypothetical protein